MNPHLTSKGMLLDICAQRSRAKQLLDSNKGYYPVLKYIIDIDYFENDEVRLPSIKELAASLDIKYNKVRKMIQQIYNALTLDEWHYNNPFVLNKTRYVFYAKSYETSIQYEVENLAVIPRIGERIHLRYFEEYLGTTMFYVSDVVHEYLDDELEVTIWLKHGTYNQYWELRKAQAFFTGEISFWDSLKKSDWEIRDMLTIKPWKAW